MKALVSVSVCGVALAGLGIYSAVVSQSARSSLAQPEAGDPGIEATARSIDEIPGVRWPRHVAVEDAVLPDDVEVLGVCWQDECRAYPVPVLSLVESHVVNDVVADVPISVTYCDLADCARVLTSEGRGAPLDLSVGGLDANSHLILLVDQVRYGQLSDGIPLDDFPFRRTTWGEWKEEHPGTLVYVGGAGQRG